MASRGSWVSVKRGDHERVLITETLPYETPLIFSGDGFYSRMKEHPSANPVQRALTKILVLREGPKPNPVTIPFSYKIRKGITEFRKLGVVHPSSLWDLNNFYERHDEWLIYQCSRSPFSIRAPDGISGSFYERNEADAMNQYKKGQVLSSDSAIHSRYNPSYFSYKGYNRLYKFFQSDRFVRLEPARIGILTDGRLRPITLGNLTLDFQSAAPSRLYWAGRPAMRFVQALRWLRDMLPSDDGTLRKRLVSILKDPDHGHAIQNDLRGGLSAMPEWMRVIVRDLLQQVSAEVPPSAKKAKPTRGASAPPPVLQKKRVSLSR